MMRDTEKSRLLFFMALLLSAFGYEFVYFIMTVHLYTLTGSALNIGVFTALTFIPKMFSSLLGGLFDGMGKGKGFALSSVLTGLLILVMAFASDMTAIMSIWFVASIFFTAIVNARGALMAEVIQSDQFASGNALALSLLNGAKLLGPLIGGLIVTRLNIQVLLYFTCLVYLAVAFCAVRVRTAAHSAQGGRNALSNAKKGFEFMRENKVFGLLTAISFFWRLCLGMQLSLFIVYVQSHLMGSSEQYGLFVTVTGLGSIVGSLAGPFVAKRVKLIRLIAGGLCLHYFAFVLLGLCRYYVASLLIVFVGYAVFYIALVGLHSMRDQITPFEIRGSAYGTVTAMLTPAAIVSMIAGSLLTERFGVASVLLFAGIAAILGLVMILWLGKKTVQSLQNLAATGGI